MKKKIRGTAIFILAFLSFVFISCGNEQKNPVRNSPSQNIPKQHSINKDSLKFVELSLEKRKKELLPFFILQQQDFPYPTYYHKNWWGIYSIRANGLTAGLDTNGTLFLVSCLSNQSAGMNHDQIKIIIGDSVFTSNVSNDHLLSMLIGAGHTETSTFRNDTSVYLSSVIARHGNEKIKVQCNAKDKSVSVYQLTKRDITGIKDCYELSSILKQLDKIRKLLE